MGGYLVNDEAGLSIAVADPSIVQILRKYGLPMMAAGSSAASMPDNANAAPSDVDAALDVARRASGGRLLEDQYPTHYLPNVGRQVMADGGAAADDAYLDALLEASRPNADIRAYQTRMREIASQPEDIRSMTHAPDKPMRPIEIEGGFIGKRELGQAPYDVAGPLSGMAQAAYSMKTLPFYFTPAMPIAAASDIGEAAIDTKNALEKGDYLSAGLSGVLGVGAGAFPFRKQIGSAVGRAVETARDVLGRVPAPVAAGAAGAAAMAPQDAEAGKADAIVRAAKKIVAPTADRPPLFDYSRLGDVPHVRQFDLPRYAPARGVPARVEDLVRNQNVREEMLKTIEQGDKMGGSRWYNADPLRDKFVEQFGPDRGGEAFRKYMDFVAATSPRSEVGANVRNASYYYNRAMTGQGMPAVGDRNPQPYGHMAQRLHQMNAERVSGEGWEPLNNPKPASFVENLVGNQQPVTVDTHAFRLPAIIARDPRFLETAFQVDKTAPKQNIAKMIESGEISLEDAANRAAYWQAQPKANEYAAMEQFYKSLGRDLGLTPAQTQAAAWVGGGARTGLKSDESKPFLKFVEDRIYKTAIDKNMDPQDVMRLFVRGEMPLYANGGSVSHHAMMIAKQFGSSPRETVNP